MHIKKASNGTEKVVMSKAEWLAIGKKAQWLPDPADPERMQEIEDEQPPTQDMAPRQSKPRKKLPSAVNDPLSLNGDWERKKQLASSVLRRYNITEENASRIFTTVLSIYRASEPAASRSTDAVFPQGIIGWDLTGKFHRSVWQKCMNEISDVFNDSDKVILQQTGGIASNDEYQWFIFYLYLSEWVE